MPHIEIRDVSLIYDTHPDGGGEPVTDEDTPVPIRASEASTRALISRAR